MPPSTLQGRDVPLDLLKDVPQFHPALKTAVDHLVHQFQKLILRHDPSRKQLDSFKGTQTVKFRLPLNGLDVMETRIL